MPSISNSAELPCPNQAVIPVGEAEVSYPDLVMQRFALPDLETSTRF
jgi:hypothetical protein